MSQNLPIDDDKLVAAWIPGEVVGRYTLLAKLATGGMAEIWLARQEGLKGFEKVVVIKRILDAYSRDDEFVEMFLDEARIAAQLSHPNVVQIFDLGSHRNAYYMAMEYLSGEELSKVVRTGRRQNKPLHLALAARIVANAADGLGYAHTKTGLDGKPLEIVHRDVSPQNLIVTYEGVVKLVDFGIAKAAHRSSRTEAGKFKGKISYLSPEQARGIPADARSDVFSLGVVLFEIVTNTRLYQFENDVAALTAIGGNWPIPTARERNPDVPEELSAIISKALDRERDRRFQTARELQGALEEWLRSISQSPGTPEISRFMHELFPDRIEKQQKLLESARSGDSLVGRVVKMLDTSGAFRRKPKYRALRKGLTAGLVSLGLLSLVTLALRKPVPAPPLPIVAPLPTVLVVNTDPPGASLLLDGKEVGIAPLAVDPIALGEHTVVASLAGRLRTERQVKLEREGERTNLLISLPAEVVPPPIAAPKLPTQTEPVVARGKLTLTTVPWTEVFLGKKKLGNTPLVNLSLPVGKHSLRVVNGEKNLSKILVVEIRAGKTTLHKEKL